MPIVTSTRPRWLPEARPQVWALGMLAAGLLHTAATFHLDERVFYSLQSAWQESSLQTRSLWLPEYQVRVEAKPVATVGNNLSGLTFDEQRNQLWAVVNNPEELVAMVHRRRGRYLPGRQPAGSCRGAQPNDRDPPGSLAAR
jgi:uncharacterized protein YjiK